MFSTQLKSETQNTPVVRLIMEWLSDQLTTDGFMWLSRKIMRLKIDPTDRQFYMVFNVLPKRIGTHKLRLDENELDKAEQCRENWKPLDWQVDHAARVAVILSIADIFPDFAASMEKIMSKARTEEVIAIYHGLPLYHDPKLYLPFAINGIDDEDTAVFSALAKHNAYPVEHFDDENWKKLVSRARQLNIPKENIIGLEQRDS